MPMGHGLCVDKFNDGTIKYGLFLESIHLFQPGDSFGVSQFIHAAISLTSETKLLTVEITWVKDFQNVKDSSNFCCVHQKAKKSS